MNHLLDVLYEHRFTVGGVAWYVVSAAIVSMPSKDQFSVWDWFYDFSHLLLNLKPIPALQKQAPPLDPK